MNSMSDSGEGGRSINADHEAIDREKPHFFRRQGVRWESAEAASTCWGALSALQRRVPAGTRPFAAKGGEMGAPRPRIFDYASLSFIISPVSLRAWVDRSDTALAVRPYLWGESFAHVLHRRPPSATACRYELLSAAKPPFFRPAALEDRHGPCGMPDTASSNVCLAPCCLKKGGFARSAV